jgi:hypothetical protein
MQTELSVHEKEAAFNCLLSIFKTTALSEQHFRLDSFWQQHSSLLKPILTEAILP